MIMDGLRSIRIVFCWWDERRTSKRSSRPVTCISRRILSTISLWIGDATQNDSPRCNFRGSAPAIPAASARL